MNSLCRSAGNISINSRHFRHLLDVVTELTVLLELLHARADALVSDYPPARIPLMLCAR